MQKKGTPPKKPTAVNSWHLKQNCIIHMCFSFSLTIIFVYRVSTPRVYLLSALVKMYSVIKTLGKAAPSLLPTS